MQRTNTTLLYLTGLFGLASPLLSPPTAHGTLVSGLEGYYQFDGDGLDATSNNRDLDLLGGVGFGSGLFGSALAINDDINNAAVRPVDDAVFDFGGADFSIQSWVNFDSVVGEQILIEKFDGSNGPGWTLTKLSDNSLALAFAISPNPQLRSAALNISTGDWHQVVVRRTGTQFDLFFDGGLVANTTNTSGLLTSSFPLLVGQRNSADGRNFALDGRTDEVAIWSRSITDGEIATLYNGGVGQVITIPEPASAVGLTIAAFGLVATRRHRR